MAMTLITDNTLHAQRYTFILAAYPIWRQWFKIKRYQIKCTVTVIRNKSIVKKILVNVVKKTKKKNDNTELNGLKKGDMVNMISSFKYNYKQENDTLYFYPEAGLRIRLTNMTFYYTND